LALKQSLAEAQEGHRFLLQGGDCAESFADCTSPIISNRLKVLLQMSLVLVHGLKKPVLRVGRFAGQYAKPRSTDHETRDGVTLPSFRGDLINGQAFTPEARRADPQRLIQAHAHSALTMNFVRALIDGGFRRSASSGILGSGLGRAFAAGGRVPANGRQYWRFAALHGDAGGTDRRVLARGFLHFARSLAAALRAGFDAAGAASSRLVQPVHALPVDRHAHGGARWCTRGIFPRHQQSDRSENRSQRHARKQLLPLIDALNPHDEPGRLTLIHRMGNAQIANALPPLLDAVKREGRRVLWVADPMHGNTESTSNGHKTRRFDNIAGELDQAFDIHAAAGTRLGGVHLELTGEDVTECMGGARDLSETDLDRAYKSMVDPRLNYEQSLELAMLIVRKSGGMS
jgi:3-deoxy-7-phosphoheptulonate synthase